MYIYIYIYERTSERHCTNGAWSNGTSGCCSCVFPMLSRTEILPSSVACEQSDAKKNHTADHRSNFSSIGIFFSATIIHIHVYIYISFDDSRLSVSDVLGETGACPGGAEPDPKRNEERKRKKKKGGKQEQKGGKTKVRKNVLLFYYKQQTSPSDHEERRQPMLLRADLTQY